MKTIAKALADDIPYPISKGFIENRLLERGLDGEEIVSAEILTCKQYLGALADCLYSLVESPNLSESDMSISLSDKNLILKKANMIYASVGEEEKKLHLPTICIGWS